MGNLGAAKDKVQRILVDWGLDVRIKEWGYQIPYESTAVNLEFVDQPDRVLLEVWAPLVGKCPKSPELYTWMVEEGSSYFFGHAKWSEHKDAPGTGLVYFSHTILADYLDPEELKGTIAAIANTGNELDDIVRARFGGERFVD